MFGAAVPGWATAEWDTSSIQDALRTFLQPIKSDDPRVDFYTIYKKEATEYDTDYVKKYDEDLSTTLIFVRCLLSIPFQVPYLTL